MTIRRLGNSAHGPPRRGANASSYPSNGIEETHVQAVKRSNASPLHGCSPASSIAAIAKEFQECKSSELIGLIKNKVSVVLVTNQRWEHVPRMFDGMHYVYEGFLTHFDEDDNRTFTMRLRYHHQVADINIQFTNREVVSLLRRYGLRSRSEDCSYFHTHGHCAFGLKCHKAHDPKKLSDKVKESLRAGDIGILDENQQHTLHIAMIEDGIDELQLRADFELFGALKTVKIEPGKSLLQNSACRMGFVTFQNARDAIRAKKILNEDLESRYRGVVQFSKQATKIHSAQEPFSKSTQKLSQPLLKTPTAEKETEQLLIRRTERNMLLTAQIVRSLLLSCKQYVEISLNEASDCAEVLFADVNDSKMVREALLRSETSEWRVDFQALDDRALMKIRYWKWQNLRRQEFDVVQILGLYWSASEAGSRHISDVTWEKERLHRQLASIRSEVRDAERHLTKLTIQSVQQAHLYLRRLGRPTDVMHLAVAIGPHAAAFAEEKGGSIREFVDCHWQTTNLLAGPAQSARTIKCV